eukprot:TRINITY_DN6656_c0_g2_i1.p1 TRINITY_DN6656_c0_g2~~TRINITY_DN6656_c0_g2_i1.p1  ORF type:complete len:600 (-),score=86.87 TRINITY_DN6656_c0_g2_i1:254-2053(-)
MRSLFSVVALVSSASETFAIAENRETPEQVHLALGKTHDSMTVAWTTGSDVLGVVEWGESQSPSLRSKAPGDSRAFTVDSGRTWYTHVATMIGLKTNTTYKYRVAVGDKRTDTFSFTNRRSGPPYRHAIFGDLGSANAFSLCTACSADSEVCDAPTCAANTSVGLVSEVAKADLFIHMGDFGYDLQSNNGTTGDQFMRNIEQLAARVPYMVNQGNHEHRGAALAHYIERFRSQPSNAVPSTFTSSNGETTNTLYFSWDSGLVHYVSFSTELWFGVSDGRTTKATFIAWLRKDLAAANRNREAMPWIVVLGHRSMYCSCDRECGDLATSIRVDLEELLMDYGVDFFLNAHQHNYERSFPVYKGKSDRSNVDPKAPIYIVSGSAGNNQMHQPFLHAQPSWSAFRSDTFGYSVLTTYNSTHAHWQQISTDPTVFPLSFYGNVIDDAWVVQHSHGPFARIETTKNNRNCSFDDWVLRDIDDDDKSPDVYVIPKLRGHRATDSLLQSAGSGQSTAGSVQHAAGGGQQAACSDQRAAVSGQQTEDIGQRPAASGQRRMARGLRADSSRQRTADSKQRDAGKRAADTGQQAAGMQACRRGGGQGDG